MGGSHIKGRPPRPGTAKSVPGQGCPGTDDKCPGTRYRGHFRLSQDTPVLGHLPNCPRTPLSWDIYPTVPGHLTYEFLFEKSSEVRGRGLPKGIDASDSDGAIRFLAKRCLCWLGPRDHSPHFGRKSLTRNPTEARTGVAETVFSVSSDSNHFA